MHEVNLKKADLITVIRQNREAHIADYKEACDGYREQALAKIGEVFEGLKDRINRLKDGQMIALVSVNFGLVVPESHEKDYDQALRMLEMSVDDEIVLSHHEFTQYVMDEWGWKQGFLGTMSSYGKAMPAGSKR